MTCLLLDFGASRVKSGVFLDSSCEVADVRIFQPSPPCVCDKGLFEVSSLELISLFTFIVESYKAEYALDGIMLCTEMHGFVLLDERMRPISNYVSWKDGRDAFDGGFCFSKLRDFISPELYLATTGMAFSPTLPLVNLVHFLRGRGYGRVRVATMPELFAGVGGRSDGLVHSSMIAGLGVFDVRNGRVSDEIVAWAERTAETRLLFGDVAKDVLVAGEYGGIPIFTGIGDLQASFYGAGNDEKTVSVNLGTGSQVSLLSCECQNPKLEMRPFLSGRTIKTITHIPSGRMLNCYIGFLKDVAPARDFWSELATVTESEMDDSRLSFGLGVFQGAWGCEGSGSVSGIVEGGFSVRGYLAALLKSYISQYVRAIAEFGDVGGREIVLSGGIPGRLPIIGARLRALTGLELRRSVAREETLDGLFKLVKSI